MKICQQIISLCLALALLCGFLPGAAVSARATEVDVQESTAPVETTVETEPVVETQPEAETPPEEIHQETVPPETESAEETVETVALEVLETMPQLEAEGEAGDEGSCGDAMTWTLDSKGTLTISGSGEMTSAPWHDEYADVIKKVIIEEGVTNIYQYAFDDCRNLANVEFPITLTDIGADAFRYCDALTKITLPENLNTIDGWAFFDAGLTEVNIPSALKTMGDSTFGAFEGCAIEKLYIEDLEHLLSFSHDGGLDFANLYINGELATDLVIPDSITSLYARAFNGVTCLESVTIPESVTSIGESVFSGCENLKEVSWPGSVGTVQSYTFYKCNSLTSLTLPAGISTINSNAFGLERTDYLSALTELRLLGNAPLIAEDGFTGVTATVYYSANNTSWTEDVFQNYGGTISWVADDTIPGTGEEEEVYIIASGTCGENVYWSLDSNGQLLVYGSANTRAVESYDMDDYASPEETPWFEYQSQIKTVTVESTVNSIGDNAFAECENLESVTIEEGVAEVGESAFSKCENLEEVTFEGSAPELGENCFEEVEATVNYPEDDETWTEDTLEGTGGTIELNPVEIHRHTYTAEVTAPTCTEGGYTTYTCECGDSYIADEVEPTGHIWDEGTITQEPTAEQPGIMTYECTVCEETMTEEIPYEEPDEGAVQRIAGADRIETALAVAKELKAVLGVEKFDSIILAAGGSGSDQTKFADALSGSYLASAKKAPILLYTKGDLSSKNLAFIEENLSDNGTIYLLGGNVSIPAEVEEALTDSGYTTKRLGGADRYQTNLIILDEAGIDSADEILIAGGQAFADSLSASATGLPIMLVNGTKTKLTTAQIEFLQSLSGKKVTILGGTAAVSADLEAAIEEAIGYEADRIYGDTREHTSAMIAKRYFSDAEFAIIAYSKMYPDGLAGGVLANALHAPLLLTRAKQESIANDYITEAGIEAGYALGGTAVMTDETVRAVFGLAEDAVISQK